MYNKSSIGFYAQGFSHDLTSVQARWFMSPKLIVVVQWSYM